MMKRRQLLKQMSALPLIGGLFATTEVTAAVWPGPVTRRDYYKELGLRTFINAAGTYTSLTGCLMRESAIDAYNYATRQYVALDELQDKVGARLAELIGCEAATVTAGAASAITLGTAGVLSGMDSEKASRIPTDLSGMKTEVIMQKSHVIGYAHAIKNCGVKVIEIETRKELEKAINDQTAMLWFLNANNFKGKIQYKEFVEVGKKYNIPMMIDAAADVPPVENLWKYTDMGFDLACFSGGKGLRGPQSCGLLLGRKDLIAAARLSAPPRGDTVGRGMKVNKEEILAMLMAVENYLTRDHESDWKLWESQIKLIADAAATVDGVETEIHVPDIANHVPSLRIRWDNKKVKMTPNEARQALRNGHPSIETVGGDESIDITTWMMNPGEERIVASSIQKILSKKS
ncbi:aminotransferase class V-fold PLP-dependent enzyme [Fulvivirgaceae bacterium BMA12]|uniref:Aminotransferase class V-fold PLP-dependent enzyme n=2 Tax=Agaribacillus aureus TaxID=3051825 RepID=A0ABT8L9Q7_9BACT|nr:aminotransferase class V-fold PLP-dependent enzyme [Fulvivirgaceae bacterium BMA12]